MTHHEPRNPDRLPADKHAALERAKRAEWLTLALRVSAVSVLYFALGSTETLTAIWLKSLWALLPPIAFLAACRIERRPPRPRFPYGFFRAPAIGFLTAALALSAMGVFLLYAGLRTLIEAQQPSLGIIDGQAPLEWQGWPMIAALVYSMLVPFIAGRLRRGLALELHDKGLYADAVMGHANWLSGIAAIAGVLGIGLGLWWADFLATLIIGADVLRHGLRHLRVAVCDLIDEVPRRLGTSEVDPISADIRRTLASLDWVDDVRVRLREEGRRLTGIAFVCPQADVDDLIGRLDAARAAVEALDWRLLDFELVPVDATRCADALYAPR